MKLIFYKDNTVTNVIENIYSPIVESGVFTWESGRLKGIKNQYILIDDDVDVTELTDDIIDLDKKSQFVKIDTETEQKKLKKQQADLVFELMTKGAL
ncbi:hypothetical protein JMM81_12365 [Bacillus sp. V3B]|uniref:hypothetical protein n=1 Tax=Bacillus sp. V3B TaxID=2804915 RepID=UPI00210BA74A|nr:hypothetical protein [Bacillus sp. V3B]MCQ6275750.1 hypothetical protein [Bacillus sp. V3B]